MWSTYKKYFKYVFQVGFEDQPRRKRRYSEGDVSNYFGLILDINLENSIMNAKLSQDDNDNNDNDLSVLERNIFKKRFGNCRCAFHNCSKKLDHFILDFTV